MDPRDGDLSPAMRNRGVEICTEFVQNDQEKMMDCSSKEDFSIVSANHLVKFGNSFVIWRQFCLMMNNIKMDPDRALLSFLSCNFRDWEFREYLCQIYWQNQLQFRHPIRSLQQMSDPIDEVLVLLNMEEEYMNKITKNRISSGKGIIHLRRRQIFTIFDPFPLPPAVFY